MPPCYPTLVTLGAFRYSTYSGPQPPTHESLSFDAEDAPSEEQPRRGGYVTRTVEVPVLIVGGGPVGLTTSVLLSQFGVHSLLVERHRSTSLFPKGRGITTRAMEVFRAEFDSAWRHGGMWIAVWHPFVSGRASRCDAMEDLIVYMKEKGGVWFARLEEISDYVRAVRQSGQWQPRVDRLPYVAEPLRDVPPQRGVLADPDRIG